MTMTYTPSWEKKNNPWDTEPDFWEMAEQEEIENAKAQNEISLEEIIEEELELDEEFDL